MVAIGNGLGNVNALDKSKMQTEEISVDFSIEGQLKKNGLLPDLLSGNKNELGGLAMFDFNKNGKLDKAELKAIEAYIKQLQKDNNDGMDDFEKIAKDAYKEAKMFDFNKNGKLDPEEKAALEAFKKAKALKGDKKPEKDPFEQIKIGIGVGIGIDDKYPIMTNNDKLDKKFDTAA